MTTHTLTGTERLAINAGQLAFDSRETRAIAIALTWTAQPMDFTGKRGRALVQMIPLLDAARELCPTLCRDHMMPILDRLERDGYLELDGPATDNGVPVIIDTSTLALRCLGVDDVCARTSYSHRSLPPARERGASGIRSHSGESGSAEGESATNEEAA